MKEGSYLNIYRNTRITSYGQLTSSDRSDHDVTNDTESL